MRCRKNSPCLEKVTLCGIWVLGVLYMLTEIDTLPYKKTKANVQ